MELDMKKLKTILLSTLLCTFVASVGIFAVACTDPNGNDGKHHSQADHTWGDWVLEDDPTWDEPGTARRTCTKDDGGEDYKDDVPALSDASVWTVISHTDATYGKGTTTVYESVYGTVTVEDNDALPLPFGGVTYHSFALDGRALGNEIDDDIDLSNKAASITFDEDGVGTGTAAPFNGTFKLTIVDVETGELSVSINNDETVKTAYMDFVNGIIAMPVEDSFDNVLFLISTGEFGASYTDENVAASAWKVDSTFSMAITYNYASSSRLHMFINDDVVYFGVHFYQGLDRSANNSVFAGSQLYYQQYVYIEDANGNLIASYGYKNSNRFLLDGYEGNYDVTWDDEGTASSLSLSGNGTAELTVNSTKYSGTYTVADGDYDLDLVTEYGDYKLTLGADNSVTLATVKVTVTFDMKGHGNQVAPLQVAKKHEVTLTAPANDGEWLFRGWYLDENYKTAVVDGKHVFNEDTTVYAKWAQEITVTVDYGKDGLSLQTSYTVVDGEALTVEVPEGVHDGQVFESFYTTATYEPGTEWGNGGIVTAEITTLYANWTSSVAYKGNYSGGKEVYGQGDHSSVMGSANLEIDDLGIILSGSKSGTIENYNKVTGSFVLKGSADSYIGAVDVENGVLAYNFYSITSKTALDNDIYILLLDKTGVNCIGADTSQWNNGFTKLVKMTYTGGETLVFVWNGRIYGNVSISSADGSVTAGNAYQANTFAIIGSDGKAITAYKNGAFVDPDGLEGTYNHASGDNLGSIWLDGNGVITAGDSFGTYTLSELANTIEVVLTVPSANAYTLKGYTIVLNTADGSYSATEKSLNKVTLTLNYRVGNHSQKENFTVDYLSGSEPELTSFVIETADDGYFFGGWYEDDALSTPYTPSALTENKTVYAGWEPYKVEIVTGSCSPTTGIHSVSITISEWAYSDADNGTWSVYNTSAAINKLCILKVTFATAGTFSVDWAASFGDSYDGLFIGKNISSKYAHDQASPEYKKNSGSGTYTTSVQAGDYIYIEALWDGYDSSSSDYAKVSNFQFVLAN